MGRRMGSSRIEASAQRRAANRARALRREHKRVRARPIIAGERVKTTIRCHDRRLFLAPYGDRRKNHQPQELSNYIGYTIARAQLLYGFDFNGGIAMGNHPHLDTTDVLGNRPNYKNSIHSCIARGVNARLGRSDSMFSSRGSVDTTTPSDEETLKDLAYTDTNPVEAGLLKWGHLWPGFTSYGWRFGESRTFRRPTWFYDVDSDDNPATVTLTRVRPKGIFPELSDDELSDKLMALCRELERDKQRRMRKENKRFMGLAKLARTKWWEQPRSWEDHFTLVPKVATSDKWRRIAELQRNQHWARAYAKADDEYCRGLRPVFPHGTWMMRVRFNVPVADKPP